MRLAFIGTVGVPNNYGGFEAFLEHCAPEFVKRGIPTVVTCDAGRYESRHPSFKGVERRFVQIPANGIWSVLHDLVAFLMVYRFATHIVVLGVSGGPWFPLFRLMCTLGRKRLMVNIDGVEWHRGKFSSWRKCMLKQFDALAQRFAHVVVVDNEALMPYLIPGAKGRAKLIGYPGDYVLRRSDIHQRPRTALTVCRIEPENNIHLLLEGAEQSALDSYTLIGNWNSSPYGRELRNKYSGTARLQLLDPEYDPRELARYRGEASVYIHGHSVGGTNPSLVEMLFYDCEILCFDVPYHRSTAGDNARFFRDAEGLARLLDKPEAPDLAARRSARERFTRTEIVEQYLGAL